MKIHVLALSHANADLVFFSVANVGHPQSLRHSIPMQTYARLLGFLSLDTVYLWTIRPWKFWSSSLLTLMLTFSIYSANIVRHIIYSLFLPSLCVGFPFIYTFVYYIPCHVSFIHVMLLYMETHQSYFNICIW